MCLNRLGKLAIPVLSAQPGTPGEPGDDGNVWLSGVGEPTAQLGNLNDYYLDTSINNVWNKKSSTIWEIITNLTGPEGEIGPVSQAPSTVPGPQGAAGATVIINAEGNDTNTTTYLTMSGNSNQIPAALVELYDVIVFDIGIKFFHNYIGGSLQKQANLRFTIFGTSITINPVNANENSITASGGAPTTGRFRVSLNRIGNFNTIVSVNFSDALGNAIAYNPVNASLNYDNAITFAIEGKLGSGFSGGTIGTSYIKCTDYTLTIFKFQS